MLPVSPSTEHILDWLVLALSDYSHIENHRQKPALRPFFSNDFSDCQIADVRNVLLTTHCVTSIFLEAELQRSNLGVRRFWCVPLECSVKNYGFQAGE